MRVDFRATPAPTRRLNGEKPFRPSPAALMISRKVAVLGTAGNWAAAVDVCRQAGREARRQLADDPVADRAIADIGLPADLAGILDAAGLRRAGELVDLSDDQLRAIPHVGAGRVAMIRTRLAVLGLVRVGHGDD